MCELLAMSANVPTDICFSFSGLIERGGNTGPHKDGWGITFYEGKGYRCFKDPQASSESKIAQVIQSYPIRSKSVISHIRQANSGAVSLENTHPFTRQLWGRNWTYAHNGQLENFKEALPLTIHTPVGSTDSEHAFCWILEQLHIGFNAQPPTTKELYSFISNLCDQINKLGVFNILLSDGEYLFVFCSNHIHYITRKAPFGEAKLVDKELTVDFKQETNIDDVVTIIATQPLTHNEDWLKLEPGNWLLFHLGQQVMTSPEVI